MSEPNEEALFQSPTGVSEWWKRTLESISVAGAPLGLNLSMESKNNRLNGLEPAPQEAFDALRIQLDGSFQDYVRDVSDAPNQANFVFSWTELTGDKFGLAEKVMESANADIKNNPKISESDRVLITKQNAKGCIERAQELRSDFDAIINNFSRDNGAGNFCEAQVVADRTIPPHHWVEVYCRMELEDGSTSRAIIKYDPWKKMNEGIELIRETE